MRISSISENASAGSGKTTELVKRYIKLLYSGVSPEDIYCITFTNKATNQMKSRIIEVLESFAFEGLDGNLGYIVSELDIDDKKRAQKRFEKILNSIHQSAIHISTIDSFLLSILRSFTFEASVPYQFDIAGKSDEELMKREALKGFVDELYCNENRNLKNELFRFGDIAREKDIQKFFLNRLSAIFDIRAELKNIGTNENYETIQNRLNKRMDAAYQNMIKSKNALADFLKKRIDKIGKRSHSTLEKFFKESAPGRLASIFSKDITAMATYKKLIESSDSSDFENLWNRYKKSLGRYFEVRVESDETILLYLISIFERHYTQIIRRERKLSFADIQNATYDLLVAKRLYQYPEYIYFRLDCRFKHLLVDEFQDTSFMQWSVIEPIATELVSGVGTKDMPGSFFYVGDPKQSIYRFRGAVAGLFDYPSKLLGMEKKSLNKNYRSDRSLIEFYNKVFTRFSEVEKQFVYEPVEGNSSNEGYVYADFQNDYDNGRILDKIAESVKRAAEAGFALSDIVILTERNKEVDMVLRFLNEHGISATGETTSSLFDTNLAQIILSVLHYLRFPEPVLKEQIFARIKIANFEKKIAELKKMAGIYSNRLLIKRIIVLFNLDGYFYEDENLQKIFDVAFAADMDDKSAIFDDFLNRFEIMLKNSNKLNKKNDDSVKIMTIHKAKGLEFDVVILPIFSSVARGGGIILSRDKDFKVDSVFFSVTRAVAFYSRKLSRIYERERQNAFIDDLNRFYVASTRAKNALFLFGAVKKPVFRYLKEFLGGHYESGKLCCFAGKKEPVHAKANEPFLEKIKETKKSGSRDEIYGSLKERTFGEAFHFAAETIEGFEISKLDECMEKVRQKYGLLLSDSDISDIKTRMAKLLKDRGFTRLLEGKIFREKSFITDGAIRRIDLLIIKPEKIDIIDYKTHYSDLFLNRYKAQLSEYADIIKQIYSVRVRKLLVFVEDKIKILEC